MEKKDNQNKYRVTQCIADRFAVMAKTDDPEMRVDNVENFAHNCALALDFIGAGKIAKGEAYDLMLRAINNEFKNEDEIVEYITHIRAERKKREFSVETCAKRDAKKLLKTGRYTTAQIAAFVGLSEAVVNELAKESDSETESK